MNRGDAQNGWDTDQFPNDIREITTVMYYILKNGGLKNGGNNFDAKVRRQSIDPADLFHGHIGGIDILARSLLNAAAMIEGGELDAVVADRYAGWKAADAQAMLSGQSSLAAIADEAVAKAIDPQPKSGRQEYVENLFSRYI
jgi:xylose isomerase